MAISILAGAATAIPLVCKLIEYVQKAVKEKNWNRLLELVMRLMTEAEEKFSTGAERKTWVLALVKASAETINYDVDMAVVSELIDNLCGLTKNVNVREAETTARVG